MKQYLKRIADGILREKLEAKGGVLIEGPKWCGKTSTAAQIARSLVFIQDPAKKIRDLRVFQKLLRAKSIIVISQALSVMRLFIYEMVLML